MAPVQRSLEIDGNGLPGGLARSHIEVQAHVLYVHTALDH